MAYEDIRADILGSQKPSIPAILNEKNELIADALEEHETKIIPVNGDNEPIFTNTTHYENSLTLTSGSYTDLDLKNDVYDCDCTDGDITIVSIASTARTGRSVIFRKTDSSANKVILLNSANGGFLVETFSSDVEIEEQYGRAEYIHI